MHHRTTHATVVASPDRRFALLACTLIVALVATMALPATALAGRPTPPPEPTSDPVIDAITPDAAPAGDVVTITGSAFGDGYDSWVEFQGERRREKASIVSWSDTLIEVTVPSKAVDGDVTVVVQSDWVSNAVSFVPAARPATDPVINAITPDHAPAGDVVAISGVGFGDTEGDSLVEFWRDGGEVQASVVSWSDTLIEVEVPDKAIEGYVVVWVNEFWPSNAVYFVPAADPASGTEPVVDSLSTYNAPIGDSITVYGSGFGDSSRDSDVVFRAEDGSTVDGTVLSWTDTEITVTVPRKAVTGYIGVVVEEFWVSNGVYFIVGTIPAVDSVSPASAPVGTQVTFAGSGFGNEQGDGYPVFSGVAAEVVSWSDTAVVAIVPEGIAAGYGGIVQNDIVSNGVFFSPYGSPSIDALSVDAAIVGERVTVTGTNFRDAGGTLTVGGVVCPTTTWTDTTISFDVPSGVLSGYVGVTQDGTTSNGKFLAVGPRLTGLSDWWGPIGTELTVYGEGFGTSAADVRVTLGGVDATMIQWTPSAITFAVPAGATSGYVGVVLDWVCSNGIYFVVEDRATITSVDATSVVAGQVVTIQGTDFGPETLTSVVAMDGRFIFEIVSWTDTLIVARAPWGVESSYLGVIKQGVASNGVWLDVAAP